MNRTELIVNLQRSRKMRVWDSFKKEMVYNPYRVEDDGGWEYYTSREDFIAGNFDMCIPMDWTSKKDEGEVDIYEGDVCEFSFVSFFDGTVASVGFIAMYEYMWCVVDCVDGEIYSINKLRDIKVIGNIFENPELIEQ